MVVYVFCFVCYIVGFKSKLYVNNVWVWLFGVCEEEMSIYKMLIDFLIFFEIFIDSKYRLGLNNNKLLLFLLFVVKIVKLESLLLFLFWVWCYIGRLVIYIRYYCLIDGSLL